MTPAGVRDQRPQAIDIKPLGDAAIVVTLGTELSDAINDRVIALAAALAASPPTPHVRDIVPALASVVVHIDPVHARVQDVMERMRKFYPAEYFEGGSAEIFSRVEFPEFPIHDIPVRYGGEEGPDLADVAAFAGVGADDVVRMHAAQVYRVYMLGFLPGFAYLGLVDPAIAAPRRDVPRQQVPAGSIGIAGRQTGIYPQVSPGGWQIIGRTAAAMFDRATGTSLLQPGDRVRFVPERS